MSREMLPPAARMRLTVEVLDLTDDNTVGYRRPQDIPVFKSRKFALPVQLEDTFETVWKVIEHRYKTNYLDKRQAASFTIKKLQDAYDCDLDLGDTVSSIFEGETDPTKRMIKVVPSLIDRNFSVPPTSNLLPGHAQKRLREINEQFANKRQRVEQHLLPRVQEEPGPSRDQPVPTTESESSANAVATDNANASRSGSNVRRSHTGDSLVMTGDTQTGNMEFGPKVKEESPELGLPRAKPAKRTASMGRAASSPRVSVAPDLPGSQDPIRSRSRSTVPPRQATPPEPEHDAPQVDATVDEDAVVPDSSRVTAITPQDSEDAVLRRSPLSPVARTPQTPPPVLTRRRDVYDVPSSPEFISRGNASAKSKAKTTYSRSPRSARTVQKEVDLLKSAKNMSTRTPTSKNGKTQTSTTKARAFQLPEPDEIESTPLAEPEKFTGSQSEDGEEGEESADLATIFLNSTEQNFLNGVQAKPKPMSSRYTRRGNLKKPTRSTAVATSPVKTPQARDVNGTDLPASNGVKAAPRQTIHSSTPSSSGISTVKLTPKVQALWDRVNELSNQNKASPKVAAPTRRGSTQVATDTVAAPDHAQGLEAHSQSQPASASLRRSSPAQTVTSAAQQSDPSLDKDRISVKPPARAASARSPVPLPENVRHLAHNKKYDTQEEYAERPAGFKKPAPKIRSSLSIEHSDGVASISEPSGRVTDISMTPVSSGTAKSTVVQSATSGPRRSKRAGSPQVSTATGQTQPSQASPPSAQPPRKRGRPKKVISTDSPGRSSKPLSKDRGAETEILNGSKAKTQATKKSATASEPIVISSAEPSSSDDSSDADPTGDERNTKSKKQNHMSTAMDHGIEEIVTTPDPLSDSHPQHNSLIKFNPEQASSPTQEKDLTNAARVTEGSLDMGLAILDTTPRSDAGCKTSNDQPIWQAQTWNFGDLRQPAGTTDESETLNKRGRKATSPPMPRANGVSFDVQAGNNLSEGEENDTRSRSSSAAVSTRSSPAVVRQPARFLSHSPTPGGVASDDESAQSSAPSSQAAMSPRPHGEAQSESDSSSESDTSDTEDDDAMPDAPADPAPESTASTSAKGLPSSPPRLQSMSSSTPLISGTSQSTSSQLPRKTPIPLPRNAQLRSSQSVSELAANRPNIRRPPSFTPLREQLAQVKMATPTTVKKTPDLRTMNLSKLIGKGKAAPKLALPDDDDDSSEDDESSESSDSD